MRSTQQRSGPVRRCLRVGTVGATIGLVVMADAGSASAQATDPPNATGPCRASATIEGESQVVDPYASSGVYTIPRVGSATYSGDVGSTDDGPIRDFDGKVEIATPPGIPSISLADAWEWEGGSGAGRSKSGTVTWELPSIVPSGVPLKVEGYHAEEGIRCEGWVQVEIEGGLFDSPLGAAALGGTAVALAGVGFSMAPKRRGGVG